MGAFVDHRFQRGFLLDEERLRRINDILTTRGRDLRTQSRPTYRVYHADGFMYTTQDIEQVLAEDNAPWNKLTRLVIEMHAPEQVSLELDFDKNTTLHIEGADRDYVFLLFSDLRQYLNNEVNVIKSASRLFLNSVWLILLIAVGASFVYLFASLDRIALPPTTISPETALRSDDTIQKLNFLIERGISTRSSSFSMTMLSSMWPFFAVMLAITLSTVFKEYLRRPIEYLYPSTLFLVGKELNKQQRRISLRHNILWGVIIAFLVAVIAGLFVWLVSN